MSTVDEILAAGWYTDRRGRKWHYDTKNHFWITNPPVASRTWKTWEFGGPFDSAQMHLLIERDQHRDVCPGLWTCTDHPVPAVTLSRMFRPRVYVDGEPYAWFSEAIDAARALAVGE